MKILSGFSRWSALVLALLLPILPGYGQNAYSFHASPATPADYRVQVNGSCVGCAVEHPERAADNDAGTAATVSTPLGLSAGAVALLRLRLNAAVPAGYVAGVVIGSNRLLDLVTLSTLRLRTYQGTTLQETRTGGNAVELKAMGANRYVVEFTTTKAFNWVEIGLGGLNDAVSTLDVYYAYGIAQGTTPIGPGYYSSFASPHNGVEYASSVNGICLLCGVVNASQAADNSFATNNYATIQTTAGVAASTRLRLRLNGTSPAGSVAGLVISTGSLIDLTLLNTLTIRTYVRDAQGNLVLQETAAGSTLLQLNLLSGNRYSLGFVTTLPFEYVELSVGALASVLNTVRVHYAFGVPGPPTTLPVSLTGFAARPLPDGTVRLTWQTAAEEKCAAFVVERALEPGLFDKVGQQPGHGTTLQAHEYVLTDALLPASATLVYYRLRQIDTDGTAHLSNVLPVRRTAAVAAALTAWPNPARQYLTVQVSNLPEGTVPTLLLTDLLGRTVLTQPVLGREIQLAVDRLPRGRYALRLLGAGVPATTVLID